ncbi:MAG: UDP-glucose 4-epimerase GalE, partial [Kordiimonadaceae bacterium]|nr:UDP-glucose 4-epimerase GalE [Kordiimonadaceae bacterium]
GGAGYIGGQAVLSLLDAGVSVCVLDDLSTGSIRPFHKDTDFYEGRVHDQDLVKMILRKHKIKAILHFAGSIKVDESITNPLKYYDNNTEASRLLIEVAVKENIETFVFSSTAAVYGFVAGTGQVCEEAPTEPLNPYGWSKLQTESLLKDVSEAYGLKFGILRYFNVAGADAQGRHGQFLEGPTHLIGRTIDAVRGTAGKLQIFGNTLPTKDGTGVRDYIHVCDLADAHMAVLKHLQVTGKSETFNLGYGVGYSVLDVVDCVAKLAGRPVPYEFVAAREGEAPAVVADVSRLQKIIGWQPTYADISKIVQSALDWADR